MLLQKYALLLAECSIYTPPICITIRLPFVPRYFWRSIRVRGRWNPSYYRVGADFGEGNATKDLSVKKRGFQWKGARQSVNEGLWWRSLQERQFSEEVWAIQWTAGLWKAKSCCSHPLPENQLLWGPKSSKKFKQRKSTVGNTIDTVHKLFWCT